MAKEKTTPAEEATKLNDAQAREQRHYFPEHNITITAETRDRKSTRLNSSH